MAAHRLLARHFGHAQIFLHAIAFILGLVLTSGARYR
jgi:hypothetical protein